ncbi:hypothetical protein SAMN05216249_1276 [Acetitomaculum ruminis DSM 5522]|uniref:DUF4366 domain-containing protein n=1 Tax=Acetitomaculum ruminis DSM 5522 TaxID=1120918 RepID=A0A1I1AGL2_9FIRM|nr:hypothetical protein [Acetitomaculum ruminis]SFB37131.1 hypothetical protein SAMN05216249_1276 [Acetitomaculum ruminis DSM 5522]
MFKKLVKIFAGLGLICLGAVGGVLIYKKFFEEDDWTDYDDFDDWDEDEDDEVVEEKREYVPITLERPEKKEETTQDASEKEAEEGKEDE